MAESSRRILIVEDDRDIAEMLETILRHDGYEPASVVSASSSVQTARRFAPAVIIIDLLPACPDQRQMLEQLCADLVIGQAPIIAITTAESAGESIPAGAKIRAVLTKPFDVDELLAKIAGILEVPPAEAEAPSGTESPRLQDWARHILATRSREVLFMWLQRLLEQAPWRGRNDLHLAALLDEMPVLIEVLEMRLAYRGRSDTFFAQHHELLDRAANHAYARYGQQITLPDVIREYAMLRNELWRMFRRYLPPELSAAELLDLEDTINYAWDRIIERTVQAYLTALGVVSTGRSGETGIA